MFPKPKMSNPEMRYNKHTSTGLLYTYTRVYASNLTEHSTHRRSMSLIEFLLHRVDDTRVRVKNKRKQILQKSTRTIDFL